jgi:tetratricopeptide (TPR) repeat protein
MPQWNPFPHASQGYDYPGDALLKAWTDLHRGDRAPFCDEQWVASCIERSPTAVPPSFDGDIDALAGRLQDAWRDFHRGAFESAVQLAEACGVLGHAPANKSRGIYATYLETNARVQQAVFNDAIERAEVAVEILPFDPNSHYFLAFNLGRYSQSISVVKALRQGIGSRIQSALGKTLELQPDHAEAHTASGMYHAEIINKVGKMIGSMTYGASADQAIEHFETALELTPEAPIAYIEYGNGLYLLYGEKKLDQVSELYEKAVELEARDAMEKLDIEAALAEME